MALKADERSCVTDCRRLRRFYTPPETANASLTANPAVANRQALRTKHQLRRLPESVVQREVEPVGRIGGDVRRANHRR